MKRFIALILLSTALAVGTTACAHQQLTKLHAAETVATAAVIAGMVLLAAQAKCGDCNVGIEDPNTSARPAQPPR
ncbi:MAG TPA: hypothetical protein VFV99_15655 [Kofleriaceae bacterium]|nr:hypothetical protein [Kofleriaceae bacterium]